MLAIEYEKLQNKTCKVCGKEKSIGEFPTYLKNGDPNKVVVRTACKECERDRYARDRKNKPEHYRDKSHKQIARNKAKKFITCDVCGEIKTLDNFDVVKYKPLKVCKVCHDSLVANNQSICKTCKEIKSNTEFPDGRKTYCKSCVSERNKRKYEKNHDKYLAQIYDYRKNNPEIVKMNSKRYGESEKGKMKRKLYLQTPAAKRFNKYEYYKNLPSFREKQKRRYASPTYKAKQARSRSRHRKLSYKPLNKWFEDSHFHHLHHVMADGSIDKGIGLYIPSKLHNSIPHDGVNYSNIGDINRAALEWYIENTPKENINQMVLDLYDKYN
jgi:hypothetical protein